MDVTIRGFVAPGFEPVHEAFSANFEHAEIGAACCVYVNGVPVVDLVGGLADPEAGTAWTPETIALVFSTTKGATAICANRLIERGALDPDAPVAEIWPEFAQNGKGDVLVRHVLSHSAGLPVVEGSFTLDQALAWDPVVEQLARQGFALLRRLFAVALFQLRFNGFDAAAPTHVDHACTVLLEEGDVRGGRARIALGQIGRAHV